MGKVYDAKALFDVAKDREKAYDELLSQLGELKKALQGVADLDGSLEGKGADNIKSFYKQHADTAGQWENLIKMQQSYFSTLHVKAEKAKLSGSTIVTESFLETELKNANSNAKEMVAQQHDDLQSILNGIDDIVSISAFSTSEFNDKIEEAEKKRTDTIEAVNQLDAEWSKEYSEMDDFYAVVDTLVSGLELATSQGGSVYQLAFDEKAYHDSELYKVQTKLNDYATSYVDYNKQQEEVYELEKKQEEEANKPWYEKTWDAVSTFTGEVSGYYDYKRAAEGVDPVTGEKLSTSQRVAAGAMAAAGFIPVVGWVGRAAKGGKAIYKTAKGLSAADHALDAYKSAKSFKVLEQTEKGLYGLVAANGLGEYMTGRDMFGNKISEEQRKASLLQALGIAGAGALSTKVAGKTAKAGANAVANGAKKLSDMRNVLSKQATQRIMPPLQSAQKAYRSSSNYVKKKISQAGDIKLAPKKVRVVEEPLTGTRMPVVDEWITGKDVGRMLSVRSGNNSRLTRGQPSPSSTTTSSPTITTVKYGDHMKRGAFRQKELEANVRYVTKEGYEYITDAAGRIASVEASQLILKKGKRKVWMQRIVGRKDRLPDDDGGHLIATQFHGSGDIDNLVAQNSQINRSGGVWFSMEKDWANALKEVPPKKVSVKIFPSYQGDSIRPTKFRIEYQIEGEPKIRRTIRNQSGG
ncbi:T7SS effector LXG polymorphic toxin [Priestia aryabhattai]|uniref:T7SS effector LXG polymorphic toxin n=2 Tax=Priestia TaxID=2800373 RepID=UPI0004B8E422|nr:T7SS effector LXG polymorphic toxin [Priestia aryabhattai]MED3999133.1 T7SS effector LXG polymorphic toxin [Priestia aryabhattai]